nr:unnamed protein product [Callosobruchus analis]
MRAARAASAAHITKTPFLPQRAARADPPKEPTAAPIMKMHTTADHTRLRADSDGASP